MNMTDTEINVAIAKLRGWQFIGEEKMVGPDGAVIFYTFSPPCPNYSGSLGAMEEVEKSLTDKQFDRYQIELARVVFDHPCAVTYPVGFKCRTFWNATARQRAEAFLRVHGKWID
jgi:hypothetical protein